MPTALVVQHTDIEGPGLIAEALAAHGVGLRVVRPFAGEVVPAACNADALIVMGGPMGVYETDAHPYLRDEMRLIEAALRAGRPVLGTCLGSQLLAAVLGARVYPGPRKEIGWMPVELADAGDPLFAGLPRRFTPLHWHGDIFDLPAGAVHLARSALTAHQAYRYGDRAWGLLFHLEATRAQVAAMVEEFADELAGAGVDGGQLLADSDRCLADLAAIAGTVFDRFASAVR